MQILISAGEISGDLHAAEVVRALLRQPETTTIHGIAGPNMQKAGCHTLVPMSELEAMGVSDVLRVLPHFYRAQSAVLSWVSRNRPDVAILVDYPGFHMRLGRKLRRMGIPVLHFIAPKLWAWGAWRAKYLRQSQDRLACIFPFETDWFASHGINAHYVGNPTAIRSRQGWSRQQLCQHFSLDPEKIILALMPGSRPGELRDHLLLLAEVLVRTRQVFPSCQFVVSQAPGIGKEAYSPLAGQGAVLIDRMAEGFAFRVDAAVAVSGTATLETALWNVPTVLIYRSSWLTVFLARRLVKLRCAGLANILLGDKPVMPELIQEACTADAIMRELLPLLRRDKAAAHQRQAFVTLQEILGNKDPGVAVAHMARELTGK